jgi:DNA-binding GntR family transcriptional regulator
MPPQRARSLQSALTPASRKSLGEDVAERLRTAILHGELSPGQRLREEELGAVLQVSRGPVRDAFMLLEREGLVRPARNRGVSVVELTRNDLEEIFTLRSALEVLAISLAIQRGDASDRAEMDQALAEMKSAFSRRITERDAAQLDVQFHDTVYRAAHHQRLSSAWEQIRLPTYWFMLSRNVASPDWREATIRGHTELVRVIKAGDEGVAAEAIREHISFAYQRILESYLSSKTEAEEQAPAASTGFRSLTHDQPLGR